MLKLNDTYEQKSERLIPFSKRLRRMDTAILPRVKFTITGTKSWMFSRIPMVFRGLEVIRISGPCRMMENPKTKGMVFYRPGGMKDIGKAVAGVKASARSAI